MIAWTRRHPVAQAVTLMGRREQREECGSRQRVACLRSLERKLQAVPQRGDARTLRVSMVNDVFRRWPDDADAAREVTAWHQAD
jgi:hypothetical protein